MEQKENKGEGILNYIRNQPTNKHHYKYPPSEEDVKAFFEMLNKPPQLVAKKQYISKGFLESLPDKSFLYLCDEYELMGGEEAVNYAKERYGRLRK